MKTLITRGHIVTASDNYHADLFIDQGTVVQIGKDLSALASAADEVIDAQGLLIFPGGIVENIARIISDNEQQHDHISRRPHRGNQIPGGENIKITLWPSSKLPCEWCQPAPGSTVKGGEDLTGPPPYLLAWRLFSFEDVGKGLAPACCG